MTIRVPDPMNSAQMQLNLERVKLQYSQYSAQISSGDAITNVGDDPSGSALILNFQSSINQNNQYLSQVNTSMSYLQNTETVATTLGSNVTTLMQLAQEGMNGTQSTTSLNAIASQVTTVYNSLINLGNTQVEGKYIFGGSATSQAPFTAAAVDGVTYSGNHSTISVAVGASTTTPTNLPGDTLFLGGDATTGALTSNTNVFAAAQNLAAALQSGNTANMKTAYASLQACSDNVNNQIATLGGWESGLNDQKTNITALTANLQSVQTSVQGVNMSQAIIGLDQASLSQQATLTAMSKMASQTNLFTLLA